MFPRLYNVHPAQGNTKKCDNRLPGQDYEGMQHRGLETGRPGKNRTGGNPKAKVPC